jgi:DNA-binding GntR family transcriptional regulator
LGEERRQVDEAPVLGELSVGHLEHAEQLVSLIVDGRATEAAQLMRGHITHSLTATAISALEDREGNRVT